MRMWFFLIVLVIVLLFVFPRKILPILTISVLLALSAGGYHYYSVQQESDKLEALEIGVQYAPDACSAARPLQVNIANHSALTVEAVSWVFSARRQGYRGELTGAWLQSHRIDGPLAPGASLSVCYPAPEPAEHAVRRDADRPENLVLGIRSHEVDFAAE